MTFQPDFLLIGNANVHICAKLTTEMTKKISTIIFDFGNVLLDLDFDRCQMQMEALLGLSYDVYHQKMPDCFRAFETGDLSEEEFISQLEIITNRHIPAEDFRKAWNSLLLDIPDERMALLEDLKSSYQLLLLSNTNDTHLDGARDIMGQERFEKFESMFDHCYYSFQMGDRKPNVSIFKTVIEQSRCIPDQTLFIDDGLMHIEGAKKAGLHAVHLQPGDDVVQLCQRLSIFPVQ